MATVCPCGCGRKIGFSRRGAAAGLERVDGILEDVTPVVERQLAREDVDPEGQTAAREFLANGHRLRAWFLEHCHGEANPYSTPNLMKLSRALKAFGDEAAGILAGGDAASRR
jgi:hypothetical protein